GVDARWSADRGHHCASVLVGGEELEPERLHAGASGAAEAHMAVERSLQTLVEQQPEGDVEPRDERYRQRDRRIERLLRLPRLLPVEIEARRGPGCARDSLGNRGEAEPGRRHERLL